MNSEANEKTKEKLAEDNGYVKIHKQCNKKISKKCERCEIKAECDDYLRYYRMVVNTSECPKNMVKGCKECVLKKECYDKLEHGPF